MSAHPAHSLDEIKSCIEAGDYQITSSAADEAGEMGFTEEELLGCVLGLYQGRNFAESITDKYSLEQDVYKTSCKGKPIYLKLRLSKARDAVVISFHADDSPDSSYGQEDE